MEQKINIAEILKDAPMWFKLYSPTYGDCEFEQVTDMYNGQDIIIISEEHETIVLDWYGHKKGIENGECIIFPSKKNRDWSTFKAPWKHKHFKPFERIIIVKCDGRARVYSADFYSHYTAEGFHATVSGLYIKDELIFPYKGNEDKLGKEIKL